MFYDLANSQTIATDKWAFYNYDNACLSQKWDSDCHFEVLNKSKSELVQKLWHKTQKPKNRKCVFLQLQKNRNENICGLCHNFWTNPHCSYLDIYISQKIRLCEGDFESKFQTSVQPVSWFFWSENSDLLNSFSFYFLQELSNPLLFAHSYCYFKKVEMFESHFCIKLQLEYVKSLE